MWPGGIGAWSATGISGASGVMPAISSARVAGSLYGAGPSFGLRWVTHTAPSTVARQIAPLRVAMMSPGRPRSPRSGYTLNM